MKLRIRALSAFAIPALLLASSLSAQAPQQGSKEKQPPAAKEQQGSKSPTHAASGPSSSGQLDRILATWLVDDNRNEIALSENSVTRLNNPELKQFASKLIQDHQAFLRKLERFAPDVDADFGAASKISKPSDTTPGQTPQPTPRNETKPGDKPSAENRSGTESSKAGAESHWVTVADMLAIKKDLNKECLTSASKELQQKSGAEFDKCFLGMQIGAHMGAISTLNVFKNRASKELSQVIAEALPTIQGHLDQAKNLMKKLEGPQKPALGN